MQAIAVSASAVIGGLFHQVMVAHSSLPFWQVAVIFIALIWGLLQTNKYSWQDCTTREQNKCKNLWRTSPQCQLPFPHFHQSLRCRLEWKKFWHLYLCGLRAISGNWGVLSSCVNLDKHNLHLLLMSTYLDSPSPMWFIIDTLFWYASMLVGVISVIILDPPH
jgi:hypothetical protein